MQDCCGELNTVPSRLPEVSQLDSCSGAPALRAERASAARSADAHGLAKAINGCTGGSSQGAAATGALRWQLSSVPVAHESLTESSLQSLSME